MTITITPELIEAVKKEIAVKKYFESSDTVTACHELFKEFVENTKWKNLPKMIFYIIMNDAYGFASLKDKNNLLGYPLKLKTPATGSGK